MRGMSKPISFDIPHKLGAEEARRRIRGRVGELASHIPGGAADVRTSWPTESRMDLQVDALGQSVSTVLDIEDTVIRLQLQLQLPAMLSFMAPAIERAIKKKAGQVLLDKKSSG